MYVLIYRYRHRHNRLVPNQFFTCTFYFNFINKYLFIELNNMVFCFFFKNFVCCTRLSFLHNLFDFVTRTISMTNTKFTFINQIISIMRRDQQLIMIYTLYQLELNEVIALNINTNIKHYTMLMCKIIIIINTEYLRLPYV